MGVDYPNLPQINLNMELSIEEYTKMRVDCLNSEHGVLPGYDCPDCLNKGMTYIARNAEIIAIECHCKANRQVVKRIEQSGLKDVLNAYTMDTYKTDAPWQKGIKQKAFDFISDNDGKWFFIGGQVGCGKTHICTAIVANMMNSGKTARYMLWRDEVVQLKACVNDDREYYRIMNPLKTIDVLYIDDFFQTPQGGQPTQGDINVAFELLNYRYNNRDLVTLISSEKTVDDILSIDEAVGSRIYERTKDYCIVIGKDQSKNYRLK